MSGHTPLTPAEIKLRKAIILPLRKGGMTRQEIRDATEFTIKQIDGVLYYDKVLERRKLEKANPDILKSHSLADLAELPPMPDTGKRCVWCHKMILKTEGYRWCSTRNGYEHDRECVKRRRHG